MRAIQTAFASIAFLALAILPCHADAKRSELVPSGHWVYDAMAYLAVESGQTTLAANGPESYAELRAYFDVIEEDSLSAQGKALYEKIGRFLGSDAPLWSSGKATLDVTPKITLEAALPRDDAVEFDFDRIARFNDRAPLVSLPVTVNFTPAVTAFMDLSFGTGFWASNGTNDFTNIPLSTDAFDANAPSRAYLSAGNAFMTVTVGRGALSVGRTVSGSMILSDACDRLDYASIVLFSPDLRVSLTPIELATDRFAYFHDVSFRPFPFMSVTISEAATVHSTLDARYLNPLMVYHNFAGWRDDYGQEGEESPVGTQFGLSADLVPVPGLRLYGQLAVNQFQTSYELSKYGDSASAIPNSIGGLAGAECIRGFRDGFLVATAEGVWTNPWLYVLSNPEISLVWSRKELVAPSGRASDPIGGWLGTPYGPGAIAAIFRMMYDVPLSGKLSAEYRFENLSSSEGGRSGIRHGMAVSCNAFFGDCFEAGGSIGYSFMKRGDWAGKAEAAVSVSWKPR